MTVRPVTRDELLVAAKQELRRGIHPTEAVVLAYAQLAGEPLNPEVFDDAANAAALRRDDGPEAVATARAEGATWGFRS